MMKYILPILFCSILALPAVSQGETWTSPDGFLSVTPPDGTPAPFICMWVSSDETIKLGIVKLDYPAKQKLIQASVERGFGEEISAAVTRLPTIHLSGYEVWKMSGDSAAGDMIQGIVRNEGSVYKLITITAPGPHDDAPAIQFLNSLSIIRPATSSAPSDDSVAGMSINDISGKIGAFAVLVLIGVVVYAVAQRKKNTTPTSLPPNQFPPPQ
jgi:hypothetical protein